MKLKKLLFISFLTIMTYSIALRPMTVQGADFYVNSTFDVNDLSAGNGLCVAYLIINIPSVIAVCTLRAAIQEANALPGKDRIFLPSGTYTIGQEGPGEDLCMTGDFDITDSLEIIGDGADVTFIDGGDLDRVLDVLPADVNVSLVGVSIIHGLLDSGGESASSGGGGIRNSGTLNLEAAHIGENQVLGQRTEGGGILNLGELFIKTSRIENNSAFDGGGLANPSSGVLILTSSSVTDNKAYRGSGLLNHGWAEIGNSTLSHNSAMKNDSGQGGGLYNTGRIQVFQSTVANNSSPMGGGLVNHDELYLQNTIVAENSGDCVSSTPLISLGHNLVGDGSCDLSGGENDLINEDPDLRPLSLNRAGTRSHSLYPGSPAIDAGLTLTSFSLDQGGEQRPKGKGYDIGAKESLNFSCVPFLAPFFLQER